MPINLRDDVAYILLKKIGESGSTPQSQHEVNFSETDFTGRSLNQSDLLGHLDYLNQKGFIDAEFSGNAYGKQDDVPNIIDPDPVDARVANTLGAEDGPLPHLISFERAALTHKGQQMLKKMEANPPKALQGGPSKPIATENMDFLEKVMVRGGLEDIFDARDLAEVVFRTMRDVMTTEAAARVTRELEDTPSLQTENKALQNDMGELWQDTNPIVRFLSQVRSPLEIDDETFLFRIRQEGGLSKTVTPEAVLTAVFATAKEMLSQERISEIASFLPGHIRDIWQHA